MEMQVLAPGKNTVIRLALFLQAQDRLTISSNNKDRDTKSTVISAYLMLLMLTVISLLCC